MEIYGQEEPISIDSITNFFTEEKKNTKYELLGLINYTGPKIQTRTPTPGHYTAVCRRGTCWVQYDDLKEKGERCQPTKKVHPELLIYCKL